MGRFCNAKWGMGTRMHCGTYGRWHEPANAKFCIGFFAEPFQRGRTGQKATGDINPHIGPKRWKALPGLGRSGRRYTGSKSFAVLPEYGGIWNDRTGSRGGAKYQQQPTLVITGWNKD